MRYRDAVGALLLSRPVASSGLVSVCGLCSRCWHGASLEAIEHAVERVLGQVLVGGRLEPLEVRTWD
jgi:hypothetical protein